MNTNSELLERNISDCPDYCKSRQPISDADDRLHLLETDGLCPLCGKILIKNSGKKTKQYEIAHIYPNSPTTEEKKVLNNVPVFGENSESFQNKILLCHSCHKNYDYKKNIEEYYALLNKKRDLLSSEKVKVALSNIDIGEEICLLMDKLTVFELDETEELNLRMEPLRISQKFNKTEGLLKNKITNYVVDYFYFIQNYAKELTEAKKLNFSKISTIMKLAYENTRGTSQNNDKIFDFLVKWLMQKTSSSNTIVCEILISYFVQNCEVFDEITQ